MTLNELKRRFPNASPDFISKNAVDEDYLGDNVGDMPIPFTESEDAQIRSHYSACGTGPVNLDLLSFNLGRSFISVALRASRLGLGNRQRSKSEAARVNYSNAQKKRFQDPGEVKRVSDKMKAWIKKHGHNRGFLGHKRTQAELDKMQAGVRAANADPNHKVNSKAFRQARSDLMSKRRAADPAMNSFSRCKYGIRSDLGEIFFRSAWEANYARYLNFLIERESKIDSWQYEPETFWFDKIKRGCRSYKPDFKVMFRDGSVEYHEVKGWMYPRAKTALKRMVKYHPQVNMVLIDQHRYKAIARQVGKIIPNWE